MSGGVDSSVAAALERDAGHDVVGVTMKLWGGESDTGCCSVSDVDDARRAAQQLGIEHLVFAFADDFGRHVVEPYVADHLIGRTPNPCLECNRHLKFDRLVRRARALGFDAVATGHHCRTGLDPASGTRWLARGADRAKDQSYVTHVVTQETLAFLRFPVGDLTKAQVRERARDLGLRTAAKPDSQDVCFITRDHGRERFLAQRAELHAGRVVDTSGREIGHVDAVEIVTIGQRKGLGGAGGGTPRYALEVDVQSRTIVAGPLDSLRVARQPIGDVQWVGAPDEGDVLVQVSAHGRPAEARLDHGVLVWRSPQRRVAPGQSIVFYDATDTYVLGGAEAC
jgi:tRNA-specific 2-thiouridylase